MYVLGKETQKQHFRCCVNLCLVEDAAYDNMIAEASNMKKHLKPSPAPDRPSLRQHYQRYGVQEFYAQHGATYRNPHEPLIRLALQKAVVAWKLDLAHVLDLACGSGEVTLALREIGCSQIDGIDPYTGLAYHERTGQPAEPYTFEQIAGGALTGRHYPLIICSFALHLVAISRLPLLAYHLAQIANTLLILTPHKRPQLKPEWGWTLAGEMRIERVGIRLYREQR
jgi:SAM-dependent methyltransferase